MYLIRLDDASEYMNIEKWDKVEKILDKYNIKPIVGIIPNNEDESLIKRYDLNKKFWAKATSWQNKKWTIAMHGYNHVYVTYDGGINPVQKRSEFAGLSLERQKEKMHLGIKKMEEMRIKTNRLFCTITHF